MYANAYLPLKVPFQILTLAWIYLSKSAQFFITQNVNWIHFHYFKPDYTFIFWELKKLVWVCFYKIQENLIKLSFHFSSNFYFKKIHTVLNFWKNVCMESLEKRQPGLCSGSYFLSFLPSLYLNKRKDRRVGAATRSVATFYSLEGGRSSSRHLKARTLVKIHKTIYLSTLLWSKCRPLG